MSSGFWLGPTSSGEEISSLSEALGRQQKSAWSYGYEAIVLIKFILVVLGG